MKPLYDHDIQKMYDYLRRYGIKADKLKITQTTRNFRFVYLIMKNLWWVILTLIGLYLLKIC